MIIHCCVSRARRLVLYRNYRPNPGIRSRCDYSLGQRMFFSLYRALGEDRFYQAARRLYDGSRSDVAWKSLDGAASGSCRGA